METTTTVLPWRHASELAYVRDCFYPEHTHKPATDIYDTGSTTAPDKASTTTNYNAGLSRVRVWTFRFARGVPHAVTATAGLVEARVHDERGRSDRDVSGTVFVWPGDVGREEMKDDGFVVSESAMRSIYAMAFLRFVNGFLDRDVSRAARRTGLSRVKTSKGVGDESDVEIDQEVEIVKGVGESSMYAHAVTIGMPVRFVDLRHRCAHGELPELDVLRRTTDKALGWLWERWWKVNAVGDGGRWVWEVERRNQGGKTQED